MKTGYKVGEIMTIRPVKVDSAVSLQNCALTMRDKHVGSLIVEEKGKVAGIITEQDIVRLGVANLMDAEKTPVSKIMCKEVISSSPDKDIYDALKLMRDHNIRHLPVFDKGGLVGFLTIKDILKIEPQLFDLIVEKFELKEEARKLKTSADSESGICDRCGNEVPRLFEASDGSMVCIDCQD